MSHMARRAKEISPTLDYMTAQLLVEAFKNNQFSKLIDYRLINSEVRVLQLSTGESFVVGLEF